ncbi:MAG TPA: helix-turn-helix domain-containing protein [Polyangiaceae bacterium]|nr:helix-turn-helix domain-containing protein [Polyangiaceae bacterium]
MILQGAAIVFADKGFRASSVEDILVAGNISRRTFYRLYKSKEEVASALYQIGTNRLLEGCKAAIREEAEPLRQIERCIDAHLENAGAFGRLVFVLGGEAQARESLLYAQRMETHRALVSALVEGASARRVDPLVFQALIIALEGVVRVVLETGDEGRRVSSAALDRARRVMKRMVAATLVGSGQGVPPLPTPADA